VDTSDIREKLDRVKARCLLTRNKVKNLLKRENISRFNLTHRNSGGIMLNEDKAFNKQEHPQAPAGAPDGTGGQFISKEKAGQIASSGNQNGNQQKNKNAVGNQASNKQKHANKQQPSTKKPTVGSSEKTANVQSSGSNPKIIGTVAGIKRSSKRLPIPPQTGLPKRTAEEQFEQLVSGKKYNSENEIPYLQNRHFQDTKEYQKSINNGKWKTYFTIPRDEFESNIHGWIKSGTKIHDDTYADGGNPEEDRDVYVIYEHTEPIGCSLVYNPLTNSPPTATPPTRFVKIFFDKEGYHAFPIPETTAKRAISNQSSRDAQILKKRQKESESNNNEA